MPCGGPLSTPKHRHPPPPPPAQPQADGWGWLSLSWHLPTSQEGHEQQSPVPATTGSPGPQSRLLCLHPRSWRPLGAPLAPLAWAQRLPEASPTGRPDVDGQIHLSVMGLGDEKKSLGTWHVLQGLMLTWLSPSPPLNPSSFQHPPWGAALWTSSLGCPQGLAG